MLLWVNTVISLLGIVLGIFVASGSAISIANMQVSWAAWLMVAAFGIPVAFGLSGIGAWLVHWFGASHLVIYLVAFPWVYFVLFIAAMLVTFKFLA
ncbi:MAG: hypothetical protein JG718_07460 [Candidatus Thiothrix moscowensis]|nr:hypothetical protein [Candidatus Thiothrix moscowensis]